MISSENKGFDASLLKEYRAKIKAGGQGNYLLADENENTDEHVHFFFIGPYEGREVLFDAVMYTLRLHHESELFEIAEHKAAQHFPEYKRITYQEDENGNLQTLDDLEEEIGLYMAEVIMEMEDEETVKVQEHIDVDEHLEVGIGLDIGLHVQEITPSVLEKFVREYTAGTMQLDPGLYSFQTQSQESP